MSKTVKVRIGNKEYPLTGEDDTLLLATAERVNEQFKQLESTHGTMPEQTLAILAALNIAENDIKNERLLSQSVAHLQKEIKNMSNMLNEAITKM